mmetsp:Transcript_13198/g.20720  ORF Transcript_13198/g.20720 Transcript_13198/m.20720 type:complete len:238 (-) Transcript_13198:671-1384(-)
MFSSNCMITGVLCPLPSVNRVGWVIRYVPNGTGSAYVCCTSRPQAQRLPCVPDTPTETTNRVTYPPETIKALTATVWYIASLPQKAHFIISSFSSNSILVASTSIHYIFHEIITRKCSIRIGGQKTKHTHLSQNTHGKILTEPEGRIDLILELESQLKRGSFVVTIYAPTGVGVAVTAEFFPSLMVIHPLRNFLSGTIVLPASSRTKVSTDNGDIITGTMHRARTTRFPSVELDELE